jgi:hypothetical protein
MPSASQTRKSPPPPPPQSLLPPQLLRQKRQLIRQIRHPLAQWQPLRMPPSVS